MTALEADSVVTAGSDLPVRIALRVGGTKNVDLNIAFAVPDSFEAGIYRLEVGSLASLGEDNVSVDDTLGSAKLESLEDVFANINKVDGNTTLKLTLSFNEPLPMKEAPIDTLVEVRYS